MTARYHLAVVSYNSTSGDLVTRAYGDVKVQLYLSNSSRLLLLALFTCSLDNHASQLYRSLDQDVGPGGGVGGVRVGVRGRGM